MDVADGLVTLSWPERIRRTMQFAIVVALAATFEPVVLVIAVIVGVLLSVGTFLALAPWRTGIRYLGVTAVGTLVAALLSIPWITSWNWDAIVGPPAIGSPGRGLRALASFEIGSTDFVALSLALYLPVLAALLLARAWRLTWAVRAGVLVVGFGAIAVFGDQDRLPVAAPAAGLLLVPVALGLAIAAAASVAAFDLDVRGGSFGWRQPLGLAATVAVIVGVVPGVLAAAPGDWDAPSAPLAGLVEAQLPSVPEDGPADYNVLLIGDARLLPIPATEYRDGVSFAVMSDDDLDVADQWPPTDRSDETISDALDQIASGSTQRAGRLLAPLGIRYIVIPEFDGVNSTTTDPMELPAGLVAAFDEQLDIASTVSIPTFDFFENTSWLPTYSLLTGATAEASRTAGDAALVRADLSEATPIFSGADARSGAVSQVTPGVVHLAVPFDENWTLDVDGVELVPRRAFGVTTAFDVEVAGVATLSYDTPSSRPVALVVLVLLWFAVLFAATRVSVPFARRRGPLVTDETLITFDDDAPVDEALAVGLDPGLDMTGQVARGEAGSGWRRAGRCRIRRGSDRCHHRRAAVGRRPHERRDRESDHRRRRCPRTGARSMSRRSLPAIVLVVLGLVGLVVVGRDAQPPPPPFFAATGGTWMPAVGASGSLTGSWYCPGVPTDGSEGVGGEVVVSNGEAAQVVGRYQVLTEDGVVADESFTVGSWSQTRIDVDAVSDADFASVIVEIEGGTGFVEQIARHPLGDSVAACSNDTSPTWYVADGYTLENSVETLVLTNPFDESVVADLRFSTENRQSEPDRFRGFIVPPRSVQTIPIAELGARDEPIIAVTVEATAGRLVVGRAQEYRGGGRFGYDVSLGAPELRDQWWFADGEVGDGVVETYSIYNPTDEEVEVTVFFGGLPLSASAVNEGDPILVPPFRVVVFDPTDSAASRRRRRRATRPRPPTRSPRPRLHRRARKATMATMASSISPNRPAICPKDAMRRCSRRSPSPRSSSSGS